MEPDPPQDLEAERQIIGSCLLSRKALETARVLMSDDDWYSEANQIIWNAMRKMHERDIDVDPITVSSELASRGVLARAGGVIYLAELINGVITAGNVEFHCRIVTNNAVRRLTIKAAKGVEQRAYEMTDDIDKVLAYARTEFDILSRVRQGDGPIPGLYSWPDFITEFAGRLETWVVPGLIGQKDVWMILAPPGAGKTTLSRQMVWAIAAGVHPFYTGTWITPQRTLLIDLENDETMAADESVEFFGRFQGYGAGTEDRAWVWAYPQGLNIREPGDAGLLDQVIGDTKPRFVALGSLYKSFVRAGDWDQSAGEARVVFDRLRARHQVTFWLEHHMPKAQDGGRKHTPFGSSVWEWWASHGRVLEKAVPGAMNSPYRFFAGFRADRRHSPTPVGFTRGGRIPWEPVWDDAHMDLLIEQCP